MPIFEYRCNDCGSSYEILFKTREVVKDVSCPSCQSHNHTKKLSTFAASMGSTSSDACSGCESGHCSMPSFSGCPNGMCGLN